MAVHQALVFAAGPAQRLLPLTEHRPKAMVIVGGKPLLHHALTALRDVGVTEVVIVVGSHAEKVQAFCKDGSDFGLNVQYVHQSSPTGTLDAVRLALPLLDVARPALLLPGHAYIDAAMLKPLAKTPRTTILTATAGDDHVQGVPVVRADRLQALQHEAPVPGSTRIMTNLLVADPTLLAAIETGFPGRKELDLALGDHAAAHEVNVVNTEGAWFPIVTPWDVLRLNEWVLDHHLPEGTKPKGARGPVSVSPKAHIAATAVLIGPVSIGDGSTIEDGAIVGPYVSIRSGCVVGAHSEVRRSILNNNVLVDSQAVIRGSILDDGAELGAGFLCAEERTARGPRGCIVGRDARVLPRTTLAGGSIVDVEAGR